MTKQIESDVVIIGAGPLALPPQLNIFKGGK